MPKRIEMKGKRFGMLVIVSFSHYNNYRAAMWNAVCDCGKAIVVYGYSVRIGSTRSCGCLKGEITTALMTKHGESKKHTREYRAWKEAKTRCFNEKRDIWKYYGGRGITMCDRWKNDFLSFLKDVGRCPPGLTLDRKDNDKGYEPGNCRWATRREQRINQRRMNDHGPFSSP